MERFDATDDYKEKREKLFGKEYTIQAGDLDAKKMCYEHNETSAIISEDILKRFAKEKGYNIDENAMQYIKDGILAHSTSRVKQEPKGDEQKAVRLADKVAYIPQDELDLLKQGVLKIDDLTPDEQGLLGLNENQLTTKEKAEYESYSPEERENYKEEIKQAKLNLKEQLRNINNMPEYMQKKLFHTLDAKVHEMQAEIAGKCFVKTKDGEIKLDGRKSRVDFYEKVYKNKGKLQNRELTDTEKEGAELYRTLREAQRMPARNQEEIAERKIQVDRAAKDYKEFLAEKEHINPMLATLWVTKAKYQDSFIRDEFPKVTQEKDGQVKTQTLKEINQRNENGWKMKSTFQFFYSNIEQIPQEFREKYQNDTEELYTNQQVVSAFIASFTNKGLDELYHGLLEQNLVISRDVAIRQVQQLRPDLNVKELVTEDRKISDLENPDIKHKVTANDILEYLYEENSKTPIVAGKNGIPPIEHSNLIKNMIDTNKDKNFENSNKIPNILSSVQDLSKQQINSKDIKLMVASVMERQNTQEIQKHIDEVNKSDEGR